MPTTRSMDRTWTLSSSVDGQFATNVVTKVAEETLIQCAMDFGQQLGYGDGINQLALVSDVTGSGTNVTFAYPEIRMTNDRQTALFNIIGGAAGEKRKLAIKISTMAGEQLTRYGWLYVI